MSTIRNTPSGRSAAAIPARTRAGCAWSWIASKAVIRSNRSGASSVRHVARLEPRVGQPQALRLVAPRCDALLGEVVADEAAVREGARHQVDGVPTAAADVGHVDAGLQARREAGHERQDRVDQRGVVDCGAVLGHQLLEARERRVRDAAAVAEALDQRLLDLGQQGDELGLHRQVVGAGGPRQPGRVLGRQRVGAGRPGRSRPPGRSPSPRAIRARSARSAPPPPRSAGWWPGGRPAIASNRPTWWPMLVISAMPAPFRTSIIRPANASARAWSNDWSAMTSSFTRLIG